MVRNKLHWDANDAVGLPKQRNSYQSSATFLCFESPTAPFASQCNRPRSIYQYSNMAPRLSGQTSIFGVVFFVSKSLLGIERQKKLEKFAILTRKPRSHARILIYRTWPIYSVPCDWILQRAYLHWCYSFCTGVTLFPLVLHVNCTALSQSESSNFFMCIINVVIIYRSV